MFLYSYYFCIVISSWVSGYIFVMDFFQFFDLVVVEQLVFSYYVIKCGVIGVVIRLEFYFFVVD